jgi:hypothetical protein
VASVAASTAPEIPLAVKQIAAIAAAVATLLLKSFLPENKFAIHTPGIVNATD